MDTVQSPFAFTSTTETYLIDYNLGLDRLGDFDSPDVFWDQIRSHLFALPSKSKKRITQLLLAGDRSKDEKFLWVLRDALAEIHGPGSREKFLLESSQLNTSNIIRPVFSTARGAATYARRRQEVPFDCKEPKHCEEDRQRQREHLARMKSELK
jgi:hypothetical protein